MDRQIIYPGQIPYAADLLSVNKNAMMGMSKLAAAILGTGSLVNGLACAPTAPASMQVSIGAGEIYQLANVDATAYSSIAADIAHQILKQGILLDPLNLPVVAPLTAGQSINYLVQATYQDVDSNLVVLPFYNASNPTQAYAGLGNNGQALPTNRKGACIVATKAGVANTTGSQTTPAPDSGYVGLWVITVAYGQTTITAPNIAAYANAPFISETLTQKISTTSGDARYVRFGQLDQSGLYKLDPLSPVFKKTAAGALAIKAGSAALAFGTLQSWAADTAVTMPALVAGADYAVYVCADGSVRADSNWSAPTGYTTANSRKIGGFHYGLVAGGTTVAGGSFATTGNGMIWTQPDVDAIAGINQWSIWDLKFRPKCDPRGMVLVGGQVWVDIYLCSTDTAANGTSKYNTNIASGTVLPKIPAAFGGNGTTTYPALNWWVANELARANTKRLMCEHEFVDSAFGVTESQSIDATASTYPATQRNAGYTSKYGIEQASGHHWIWGQDSNFYSEAASPAWAWKDVNGNTGATGAGRGQLYSAGTYGLSRVLLGGTRANGANSGSRASNWYIYPWYSGWYVGLRAACDHMISA